MALKRLFKKAPRLDPESHHAEDHAENHPLEDGESNWLVSYADMMTLLCGFFIMLFSMAKVDEPQFEKVRESMARQFGGDFKTPSRELAKFVTQVIQESGLEKDTVIRVDPLGVSITFSSSVFFDTLSADVKAEGQIVLDRLIEAVASRQQAEIKQYRVVVEGHTDSRPVTGGPFASNWELSGARAARVVRMFLDRGFRGDRLTAIGYADSYPEAPSRAPAGEWIDANLAKNRRVVLRVMEPRMDLIPFPETRVFETYGPDPLPGANLEDPATPAH